MGEGWHFTDWGYKVTTQDQLTRAIARIGTLSLSRKYVWRGVPDHRWRMNSSLYRLLTEKLGREPNERDMRAQEIEILAQAREWRVGIELGDLATDLQLLASLQHHGVPTRLLDVTSNPMTGLWFACQRAPGPRDAAGVLFAIDATDMRRVDSIDFAGRKGITWGALEHGPAWTLRQALAQAWVDERPFLLRPTVPDERMKAQEGMFVGGPMLPGENIPLVDYIPLNHHAGPGADKFEALFAAEERTVGRPAAVPFCALVIPTPVKERMRRHLAGTYNRSRATLFPDIDGFRDAIRVGEGPDVPDLPEALTAEEMAKKDGLLPEDEPAAEP